MTYVIILGVLTGIQILLLYINPTIITATGAIITTLMLFASMMMTTLSHHR